MSEKSKRRRNALAIGLAAGVSIAAVAKTSGHGTTTPFATEANSISANLYNEHAFPHGVPVTGILNGTVTLEDTRIGASKITYKNPVILQLSSSEKGARSLNDSWIAIPSQNSEGHVVLHPEQIKEGTHGSVTETVHITDNNTPVLYGAAVYATSVSRAPDELIGFDINGNGNFSSTVISSNVQK